MLILKHIINKLFLLKSYIVLLIISLGITIIFCRYVSYNEDEFVSYHILACHFYKNNMLNSFRESCSGYDLNLYNTGLTLPLRSYHYIGSFPSIYYLPLFSIWSSPISARFLGMIFLLVQSIILSKLFKIKLEYIFIGFIFFFPYLFQHLVDTGPIGLQTTSIFIIYYLLDKWFRSQKFMYPILISILIFLSIWTKLTYIWLLPGTFLLLIIKIIEYKTKILQKNSIKKIFIHLLISFVLLIFLLSSILLATTPDNPSFMPFIDQLKNSNTIFTKQLSAKNILEDNTIIKSLINPLEATQRIYEIEKPTTVAYVFDIFIILSIFFLSTILLLKNTKYNSKNFITIILFILSFLISLVLIIFTKNAWAMHHTILSFPFIIITFFYLISSLIKLNLKRKILNIWLVIFVFINLYFFYIFPNQKIRIHDDPSKVKLNKVLNNEYLAKNYFFVVIDWSMYYIQSLYGNKNQSVLYFDPIKNIDEINKIKEISYKENRKILFVYNSKVQDNDIELIKSSFNLKSCDLINEDSAWNILLEEYGYGNLCFVKEYYKINTK